MKRMKEVKKNDYRLEAIGQLSGIPISKAIEILQNLNDRQLGIWFVGENNAVKLGIEALRQVKESRFDPSSWEPKPLPGETEE